jgi:hypothetical protein
MVLGTQQQGGMQSAGYAINTTQQRVLTGSVNTLVYTSTFTTQSDLTYTQFNTGSSIYIAGQTLLRVGNSPVSNFTGYEQYARTIDIPYGPSPSVGQSFFTIEIPTDASNVGLTNADEPLVAVLISRLFNIDPMPEFEDGIDNLFSEGICHIVAEFGNKGIDVLERHLIVTDNVSCVGEALRTLGRVDDTETVDSRLRVLVVLLKHQSAIVRDAAAIGLAYLGDQRAIPAMTEAIGIEPLSLLRNDMEAIRRELNNR